MKKVSINPLGVLCGLLGGLVASIPWILLYIYGGFIVAYLAVPIALGVKFGYTKAKGEVNKYLPMIITITSLVVVSIVSLVIIPLLLLNKEGYLMNFFNLKLLYTSSDFLKSVMWDYVISIVFAFLGIGGVTRKIKQEL